jgi:single-strand DNA-binding protein
MSHYGGGGGGGGGHYGGGGGRGGYPGRDSYDNRRDGRGQHVRSRPEQARSGGGGRDPHFRGGRLDDRLRKFCCIRTRHDF